MGNLWIIEADLQRVKEPPPKTLFNFSLSQGKRGLRGRLSVLCVNVLEYTQRRGAGRGKGGGGLWVSDMIYHYPEKHPTSLHALNDDQGSLLVCTR